MSDFKVGDPVVMIGKAHIAGRKGTIIALGGLGNRIHVHWTSEEDGQKIRWRGSPTVDGLKTWVSAKSIAKR